MADRRWARAFRTRTGECHDQVRDVSKLRWRIRVDLFHSSRQGDRYTHAGGSIRRAWSSQTSFAGALQPLAERAARLTLPVIAKERCDHDFNLDATKEKNMKLSQACRIALIGIAGFLLTTVCQRGAVAQTKSPQGVRNIVMVHGAWADGSSWSRVIPLLQATGLHVLAVQNPLTSLADDVAATKRAIASQDGPVLLVGHSYGGAVITEAGSDPKVVGLVYVAAFAPSDGESVASVSKPFSPAPIGSEVRADASGFLTVTAKGIAEDFAQDLPDNEKQVLTATQGATAAAVFEAAITTAAWKTKPSWFVIASNDRAVAPELEKAEAAAMKATSITVPSSHVPMLSHPKEVADLIERAAHDVRHAFGPAS